MSEIKVNSIKGVGASAAAITVNNTDGTCTANLTNRTNKNLVANGSCLIAQRGTSSTTSGYGSLDRFLVGYDGVDESPTQSQVDVASGTTPYTNGFRKALRVTNGNQSNNAGAGDYIYIRHQVEAQNVANSGWNYVSSSSNITLSFWVKSSVSQNFYCYLDAAASSYTYVFETGTLTADTWTKITKTISGNSNLVFNNDSTAGLKLWINLYWGTNYTGSVTLNTWGSFNGSARVPAFPANWYETDDATFEITGVQLEVSDHATDFEHLSFADNLRKCQRYYQKSYNYQVAPATSSNSGMITGSVSDARTNRLDMGTRFELEMRSTPTLTIYRPLNGGTGQVGNFGSGNGTSETNGKSVTVRGLGRKGFAGFTLGSSTGGSLGYHYQADAEL